MAELLELKEKNKLDPKVLKELQSQYGGLIGGSMRSKISGGTSVLVVGVGGMGCKTVNQIAKQYAEHFENDESALSLLAIDTNQEELDKINPLKGGFVKTENTFPIYDPAVKDALKKPRSAFVKSIVSDDVGQADIGPTGANGIRCVGRVMLCASPKYGQLLDKLREKINNLSGPHKQIIFIAGISGGTGSGTFIDIGYMLEYLTRYDANATVYGVFYTPDVQQNETGIKGKVSVWSTLEKNGYASLKELDYFMGLGKNMAGDVYTLNLPYPFKGEKDKPQQTMTSDRPILKDDQVFLVSATDSNDDCMSIINETAVSLLNMFRESIKTDELGGSQSVLSNICNKPAHRAAWLANIGASNDENKSRDPAGMDHTDLPVFMGYHYSSLGYRSVYIPRNEMAAYCISLILDDLYEKKFKAAMAAVTPEYIANFEAAWSLDSLDTIIRKIKELGGVNDHDLRLIDGTHTGYPEGGVHLKKGQEAIDDELALVAAKCQGLQTSLLDPAMIEYVWSFFRNLINQQLLDNSQMWDFFGPYGVVALLTGHKTENGMILGLIDHIKIYATTGIQMKIAELQQTAEAKYNALLEEKKKREADIAVTKKEVYEYVDLCEDYGKAMFEVAFAQDIIAPYLIHLYNYLAALNNTTFATYIPMLELIKEIVNKDTEGFMAGGFAHGGTDAPKYVVNGFTLDKNLKANELFQSLFEGYINDDAVQTAKDTLTSAMFSKANRPYWESLAMSAAAKLAAAGGNQSKVITDPMIMDKLRQTFSVVTKDLVGNMLQMLIAMLYCDPNQFRMVVGKTKGEKIELADLKKYWNNEPAGRDLALAKAAEKIVAELLKGDMIAFDSSICTIFADKTDKHREIWSIPELGDLDPATPDNLNKKIKGLLPPGAGFGLFPGAADGTEPRTEICAYLNTPYIPLPFINGMRVYAEVYYESEQVTEDSAGRHGDEVNEKWQLTLPEIYGVDAENYFAKLGVEKFKKDVFPHGNHDRERYDEIRGFVDYAKSHDILYLDDNHKYHLFVLKEAYDEPDLTQSELLAKISEKYLNMLDNADEGQSISWRQAVEALEEARDDEGCYHEDILLSRSLINTSLADAQAEPSKPEDTAIQNLHRVIRSDLRTQGLLSKTCEFFKQNGFFDDLNARAEAQLQKKAEEAEALRQKKAAEQKDNERKALVNKAVGYFLAAYRMGAIKELHSKSNNKDYLVYENDGKPLALVDLSVMHEDIDEPFKWYLAVSVFYSKTFENKDEARRKALLEELPLKYASFLSKEDSKPLDWREDVYGALKKAREKHSDVYMASIYEELGDCYLASTLRDGYSYPVAIVNGSPADLGRQILANIDIVLDAMKKRERANDRTLTDDIGTAGTDEVEEIEVEDPSDFE